MRRLTSPTHPYQDDTRGPRIQKVLADAGMGSRRNCETAVDEGRVTVNGHRIDGLPAWVNAAEDDIRMDGRRIKPTERDVYVMLFKPKGYLSTNSDPEGRALAVDLVQHPSHARLFPVGRLDAESSGLLLMTNDGALANRLTHPRFEMAKGYEVMVNGRVNDEDVERLERGIFVPGKQAGEEPRSIRDSCEQGARVGRMIGKEAFADKDQRGFQCEHTHIIDARQVAAFGNARARLED